MIHEFGPYRYDAVQRLLFRGTELVPLVPKALDTLHVLLERRGQVVEKAELLKLVWPDTTVEEVGLARNVSILRKELGEYIETIPKRGYRFVAPSGAAAVTGSTRGKWLYPKMAAALVVVLGLGYWLFYWPSPYLSGGTGASLAVVPFPCACPGMDGEAFAGGLNDVLVASLAKAGSLRLAGPSTVARYQRAGVSMSWMGRLLGLDALMEGRIQKLGDRLRVSIRLVEVRGGGVIWAETYDRPAGDPASAQATLAQEVSGEVVRRLSR